VRRRYPGAAARGRLRRTRSAERASRSSRSRWSRPACASASARATPLDGATPGWSPRWERSRCRPPA